MIVASYLINILKLGAEGINSYAAEATKMGLVLTEKNIGDFDKYMQATRQVQGCIAGLQVQLGVKLLPKIVQLCGWVETMVRKWENLSSSIRGNIIKWGAFLTVLLAITPQMIKLCTAIWNVVKATIACSKWLWTNIGSLITNILWIGKNVIGYELLCAKMALAEGQSIAMAASMMTGTAAILAMSAGVMALAGSLIYLGNNKDVRQGVKNLLSTGTVSGVSKQALDPNNHSVLNQDSLNQMKAKGYSLKDGKFVKAKTEINVNINAPKGTVSSVSSKSTGSHKVGVSTAGRKVAHAH